MNDQRLMSKKRLTDALARFDPVVKEHGLGGPDLYMVSIPQSISFCAMMIFRDQIPEDNDTRIIREAMGKLHYRFREDL